jgi:hypothetical protein
VYAIGLKLTFYMKKFIIALLLLIPIGVYAFTPATLFRGNTRVAVKTQTQAQQLFSQGYQLEQKLGVATSSVPTPNPLLLGNNTWTGRNNFASTTATNTISGNLNITKNLTVTASTTLSATTTISASSLNGSPLTLNGQAYQFPTSQNASSSLLMTDNAGTLTWETPFLGELISSQSGTTSLSIIVTIPAGTKMITSGFKGATTQTCYGDLTIWTTGKTVAESSFECYQSSSATTPDFKLSISGNYAKAVCSPGGTGSFTCDMSGQTMYFYK